MKPQTMKLRTLLLTAIVILSGCNGKTLLYKDASRSAEERADDLLKRMTVEEKLGQLICPPPPPKSPKKRKTPFPTAARPSGPWRTT